MVCDHGAQIGMSLFKSFQFVSFVSFVSSVNFVSSCLCVILVVSVCALLIVFRFESSSESEKCKITLGL